jgi:hypothetical protein
LPASSKQAQPGRQHPVGGAGGLVLGGGDDLLGDGLKDGAEQALLVGGGVQVQGVLARQEVLKVQGVPLGECGNALVAVDVEDLLGGRVEGIDRPIGPGLRRLPGIQGRLHTRRFEDFLDVLVFAGVEPVQHVGHAQALDGGGVQHGGEELDPRVFQKRSLIPVWRTPSRCLLRGL